MPTENDDNLHGKVKDLNEYVWENRAKRPAVNLWLDNFTGEYMCETIERNQALYLLSKFLYFGQNEVRQLLRSMFKDLIRHHLSVKIRSSLPQKNDFEAIHDAFLDEIDQTRFLGLGNPAESGTHILYDFRLVNGLPLEIFVNPHDLFSSGFEDPDTKWSDTNIQRLIFIDDFCGTGEQAGDLALKYVPFMKIAAARDGIELEVWYLTLFATTSGLSTLRNNPIFDRVETVSELDATYRVFDEDSQLYADSNEVDDAAGEAEAMVRHYGKKLEPGNPLGYKDCQLLLGFHHNVPDNTLPIIWSQDSDLPWHPIFPRYTKIH